MMKLLRGIRDAIKTAITVFRVRLSGEEAELAVVPQDELRNQYKWLAVRDYENQLMQVCIDGCTKGESPCAWCEEHAHGCTKEQHMKSGCSDWWLRFLTDEEDEACEQKVASCFGEGTAETDEGPHEDTAD